MRDLHRQEGDCAALPPHSPEQLREELRALYGGEVPRPRHDREAAPDGTRDRRELLRRRGRVVLAGDAQRRHVDPREPVAHVPGRKGLAASGVPFGLDRQEHLAEPVHVPEHRREPAVEHRVYERLEPLRAHQRRPLEPLCLGTEAGGRAADDEPFEALGRVERELQTDGAAEREADEPEPGRRALEDTRGESRDSVEFDDRLVAVAGVIDGDRVAAEVDPVPDRGG